MINKAATVESILQDFTILSLTDLKLLRDALDILIEQREYQEMSPDERAEQIREQQGDGHLGYIEDKMINGCGPYRYLRVRQGGKHRSFYLGKAN